ncbi:uncharacterized protein SPAPADRAFT_50219 [Spathaspora passalidarum NRRL Y-27907]|uniref:Uncharacterized protein n=1 Tax=Spathaspora passalidarum (strain NRRL Y-27907 / 11-Y1) TaxID=619300 RepID=G3ALX4_SPAPN|nr:uncharacterized protein SPAPADRAFT_50219 [Spathaspora passalidarum NRRL Y-27907]EGW33327.1 hypothetical protein SPAPADRAFT_50219 [Spathaspora passalidarum NRRL Y-27907]
MSDKEEYTTEICHTLTANSASKCLITGDGNEFVILGNQKYYRHELMHALSGLAPVPTKTTKYGQAECLGLFSTSFNVLILGTYLACEMSFTNLAVCGYYFIGGLLQFLSGCWCFVTGNTFGYTAFCSFGAFWLTFGAIYTPGFGILEAYKDHPEQLYQGVGFLLLGYAILTTGLLSFTFKTTYTFIFFIFTLDLTVTVLSIAYFTNSAPLFRAGGIIGMINGISGWYETFLLMSNPQNTYWVPRQLPVPVKKSQ